MVRNPHTDRVAKKIKIKRSVAVSTKPSRPWGFRVYTRAPRDRNMILPWHKVR